MHIMYTVYAYLSRALNKTHHPPEGTQDNITIISTLYEKATQMARNMEYTA